MMSDYMAYTEDELEALLELRDLEIAILKRQKKERSHLDKMMKCPFCSSLIWKD